MRMQPNGDVTAVCDTESTEKHEDCYSAHHTVQMESTSAGACSMLQHPSVVQKMKKQASSCPLPALPCTFLATGLVSI